MLPADDAAVVARDPSLPGLAAVLDSERLAERLAAQVPGAEISGGAARYVRYKPGTSCLVQHELVIAGRRHELTAKAFTRPAAGKARKLVRAAEHPGPLGPGGVLLDDDAAAVLFAPNDPQLPALAALSDPARRDPVLRRLVAALPSDNSTFTLASHRPERRFVGQVETGDGARWVVKGYRADEFGHARSASKAFAAADDARVAPRLGSSARHRLLAFGFIAGDPLDRVMAQGDVTTAQLEELGALLAVFQDRRSRHLRRIDRPTEAMAVLNAAQAVAATVPHLASRVREVGARVAQRLLALPAENSAVHGDFSADQVVVGDSLAIIDYDAAGIGDAASDLARFSAVATAEVIAGRLPAESAERAVEAVLTGHAQAAGTGAQPRVALHRSAWLLRLAPEPFRRRSADWVDQTERLVAAAK